MGEEARGTRGTGDGVKEDSCRSDRMFPEVYCPRCDSCYTTFAHTCPARMSAKATKNPVEVLHRLWGEAAGRPGYDKADWLALQRAIEG